MISNQQKQEPNSSHDIFQNGIWSIQRFKDGKEHGLFSNQIEFNSKNNTYYGYGNDHLGTFLLTGKFSKEGKQINILLDYQNSFPSERDQKFEFQLVWNESERRFKAYKQAPIGWSVLADVSFEMSFVRAVTS